MMRKILMALMCLACLSTPALAQQTFDPNRMVQPIAEAPPADLRPQIQAIEGQIARLEQRPVVKLSASERRQLATLQKSLETILAAKRAANEAASAADLSKGSANDAALVAMNAANESQSAAAQAAASATVAQEAVTWIKGLGPWMIAAALLVIAFLAAVGHQFFKFKSIAYAVRNDVAEAKADAAAAINRFVHDVRKTPHTPSEEQLALLLVGTERYAYQISVNGSIETHKLSVPCLGHRNIPMILVGELFSIPVTPDQVFHAVCAGRERFGNVLPPMLVSVQA